MEKCVVGGAHGGWDGGVCSVWELPEYLPLPSDVKVRSSL